MLDTFAFNCSERIFSTWPKSKCLGNKSEVRDGCSIVSLSFSVVHFFAGYENVALFRQARQSSTLNHPFTPIAEKAVDGVVDGQFNVRSTTHTNGQVKPWWEVNLGAEEIIYGVTLYNRLDCCGNRLQNFDVVVTNNSGKVTKTTHFGVGVRITYPVSIPDGVVARKVKVQLRGNAPLQLAEVQVWAGESVLYSISCYLISVII